MALPTEFGKSNDEAVGFSRVKYDSPEVAGMETSMFVPSREGAIPTKSVGSVPTYSMSCFRFPSKWFAELTHGWLVFGGDRKVKI